MSDKISLTLEKNYKVVVLSTEHLKKILTVFKKLSFKTDSKKVSRYLYIHTDKTYEFIYDKDLFEFASMTCISSAQLLQKIKH